MNFWNCIDKINKFAGLGLGGLVIGEISCFVIKKN